MENIIAPVDESFYAELGKEFFNKIHSIYNHMVHDNDTIKKILTDIINNNSTSNKELFMESIINFSFSSSMIDGYNRTIPSLTNHLTQVNDYWLDYLVNKFWMMNDNISHQERIKRIAMDYLSNNYNLTLYREHHFTENSKFRLTYHPGEDNYRGITLIVPYTLDALSVECAIKIIEEITTAKIGGICFWYYTTYDHNDQPAGDPHEIEIGLTEKIAHLFPYVPISIYKSKNFNSIEQWYLEIPEFAEHIKKVDFESENERDVNSFFTDASNDNLPY